MQSRRFVLVAGAWLLSAAAAFSLGRATIKQVQSASTSQSKAVTVNASAAPTNTATKPSDEEFSLTGWFGSKAAGLTEVLNGRSLEDHVKHLLKQDDEAMRMLGFLRLLEALEKPEDIKAVLDVINRDQRGGFRSTEQALLLQKWAKLAPSDAAAYANGQRDWSRLNGLNAVLKTWVKSNSEDAIAWAQKNGVPQGNDGQPGRGGPGGGEDGNWAVATLIGSLSKTNLDRALQVAAEQPYSRARGRMADTLISEIISQRGEDAARDTVMGITDGQFQAGMARELAQRIARQNPQDAASWANGLPAGETRQRAMAEVIQEWADKDAVAAGQFLQQLGTSPEFDRARQDYAMRVVRNDPEGALAWVQAITDEQRRSDATQEVLGSWIRRDQNAATAWAQNNGVQVPQTRSFGGGPGFSGRGRR